MRVDKEDPEMISFAPDPNIRGVDEVMNEIFDAYGMERLGGASGRGWSSYATFQRCPYLYKVSYLDGERGIAALALETGSAFHTFMALYYEWMVMDDWKLTPEVCREEMMARGYNPTACINAWRTFDAYVHNYENDYLLPISVEEWAQGEDGNTCRFDMIARVTRDQPGIPAGTYIVEHKTASRFTADLLEGWHNDGEVLGQIMIYKQANFAKKLDRNGKPYGKLQGTIVNIAGKQQSPKFHRTIVPAQAWHVKQHQEDLQMWHALQQLYRATGVWPKARNNCVGRYGMCQLFTHCSTNQKDTPLVALKKAEKKSLRTVKTIAAGTDAIADATAPIADATEMQLGLASEGESSDTTNGVVNEYADNFKAGVKITQDDQDNFISEWTNTLCSVCSAPQFTTPGGDSCENDHGGAPPLDIPPPTSLDTSSTETIIET